MNKTYVSCHSPSLAWLLFENSCCDYNQVGLLLGCVENLVFTSTTDENEASEEEKTVIYVEHCVPLPDKNIFGPYGEPTDEFRRNWYEPHRNKIIGWYSFRRNTKSTRCSFRECLVHKSLTRLMAAPADTLVIGLFSATMQASHATHSFNHSFFRMNRKQMFEPLHFKIYSLSDKLTNNSGYLKKVTFPLAKSFCLSTSSQGLEEKNTVLSVRTVHKVASSHLSDLAQQLLKLEACRQQLEEEVYELQRRLLPSELIPDNLIVSAAAAEQALGPHYIKYKPDSDYVRSRSDHIVEVSDSETESEKEEDCTTRASSHNEFIEVEPSEGTTKCLTSEGKSPRLEPTATAIDPCLGSQLAQPCTLNTDCTTYPRLDDHINEEDA